MELWQYTIVVIYAVINLSVVGKSIYEIRSKKNAFGLIFPLTLFGMFVWGDVLAIGIFWIIASLIVLVFQDWYLFLLTISVFWVVRSLGETVYWLNQQFSKIVRNPPESLPLGSYFPGDSIWFINQIFWQCMSVVSIIFSIYFTKLWLDYRF